jgi:hypothetical protein
LMALNYRLSSGYTSKKLIMLKAEIEIILTIIKKYNI